jgi:hypothetical protein
MKMKKCEECEKTLGIFEGYRHPVFGRNALLCSHCFDIINDSMNKWREANLPYVDFFKNDYPNKSYRTNIKNYLTSRLFVKKCINKI